MIIRNEHDSPNEWQKTDSSAYRLSAFYGVLHNKTDSFLIQRVDNLADKKFKQVMFGQPAKGFSIFYQGQQVAAFQTSMKNKV